MIIKVFCTTYKEYTEANRNGEWIDLLDFSDRDEFEEYCNEIHKSEEEPEFMYIDKEVPELLEPLFHEDFIDRAIWNILDKFHIYDFDDEDDILSLHNEYADGDDMLMDYDLLEEIVSNMKPMDAFRLGAFSEFSWTGKYFFFNGYGNIESTNNPLERIDLELLLENMKQDT